MIPEPKTIRESNIFVAGIEARLGLVQKMVWGVIALLGTLLAGAAALYVQIGDLRTDLAVVKTNVTAINDRVVKMDKSIDEVRADETRIRETLTRIEMRLAASSNTTPAIPVASLRKQSTAVLAADASAEPAPFLSDWEAQLIRETLKDRARALIKPLENR